MKHHKFPCNRFQLLRKNQIVFNSKDLFEQFQTEDIFIFEGLIIFFYHCFQTAICLSVPENFCCETDKLTVTFYSLVKKKNLTRY